MPAERFIDPEESKMNMTLVGLIPSEFCADETDVSPTQRAAESIVVVHRRRRLDLAFQATLHLHEQPPF